MIMFRISKKKAELLMSTVLPFYCRQRDVEQDQVPMTGLLNLLPAMGLEPIRGCPQQILSLPRLPFRHAGISNNRVLSYHNCLRLASYFIKQKQ